MQDLFNFSESGSCLNLIVTEISRQFIENHKEDVMIDMPQMYNTLYNGYPVYMCVRKNGFDTINRFAYDKDIDCVSNDKEFEKYRPNCEKSLGADVYIKLYPHILRMDIIINNAQYTEKVHNFIKCVDVYKPMMINIVDKFIE